MYDSIVLTLILLTLLWIAIGLQIVASSIRSLGRLFRYPTLTKLRNLERNNMPWILKMVVVKVVSHVAIRYIGKKLR